MPPIEVPRYLHPDFDPMKMKMDSIREVLIHHKVKAPTGVVRKQELVDLFEKHIRPQAAALRSYYENISPSEEGIVKVPRSSITTTTLDFTPPESRTKPTRQKESQSLSSSASSSSLSKHTVIRNNHSDLKWDSESIDTALEKKITEEKAKVRSENFSDENPFQSAGDSERRRRSKSRDSSRAGSSRSSSRPQRTRRKSRDRDSTLVAHYHVFNVPSQDSFSTLLKTPKYSSRTLDRNDIDVGPYPSSPLQAKSKRIAAATLPQPRPMQFDTNQAMRTPSSRRGMERAGTNWGPMRLLILTALFVYALWYRQTRFDIGFCTPTNNPPSRKDLGTIQQHIAYWLYPTCIPCPDGAMCQTPESDPICPPNHVLRSHVFSFGNVIPLKPICVRNKAKEYQSTQVADVAESILRRRAGDEECKESRKPPASAELFARQRMTVGELKNTIESMKDSSVSAAEFEEYWALTLMELDRRSVRIAFEEGIGEVYIRSLEPSKTLSCRIRHALVEWVIQYQLLLIALTTAATSGILARYHISRRRKEIKIINGLVANVLAKLAEQAHYCHIDPILYPDPFVPQIHLRDALLADVYSPARRNELWEKVSAIVDMNASVRVSAQEVRGEIHRVWEWVGATGVLSCKIPGSNLSNIRDDSSEASFKPTITTRTIPRTNVFASTKNDVEQSSPVRPFYPSLLQD
ncbi:inner nuclear membrane protein enriched at telomere/subtelomere region [Mortierella polycephala]|uniref:Inner nuclear membrane protein enriched at telomere/subtelomere region n=1 Tax=Mortierella polycephala TaxID=41804 RepID=A0A9P6PQN6_9FUNG|nr:inner nuclear membrane protein enriched at telomere/subtelomere region [Mortierella polycephala]